jgi:PAS domain S-box-containing protein
MAEKNNIPCRSSYLRHLAEKIRQGRHGKPSRIPPPDVRFIFHEPQAHQIELILNTVVEGVYSLDLKGNLTFANPSAAKMLGYEVAELLGRHSHSILRHSKSDGSIYPESECPISAAYRYGVTQVVGNEFFWRKDGSSFPVRYISNPIIERGEIKGAVVSFSDITEREKAQEALKKDLDELERRIEGRTMEFSKLNEELERRVQERTSELEETNKELEDEIEHRKQVEAELISKGTQLRNLYLNLHSASEQERAGIAREIHDELGQIMTVIKMDLAWIKEKYYDHRWISEKTSATMNLIDATIKSVRRICTELRPDVLDHLGLGAAIQWQVKEFQNKTGISCEIAVDEDLELDSDRSIALFRTFQEALTNVSRHANATKVTTSLKGEDDKIILEIIDNGKGITEEEILKPNTFGLLAMRERVYPWRGSVSISSSPNAGTKIEIILPRLYQ